MMSNIFVLYLLTYFGTVLVNFIISDITKNEMKFDTNISHIV